MNRKAIIVLALGAAFGVAAFAQQAGAGTTNVNIKKVSADAGSFKVASNVGVTAKQQAARSSGTLSYSFEGREPVAASKLNAPLTHLEY